MTIIRTPEQRARHWANWQIALRTGVAGLAIVTTQTALANPSGGNVVAGNATINGQGTDRVRIDQSSDRVIINWDNFSIGSGQGVDFRQPGARSIALNRVTGPEISQIMGELTANGQVYLINGNGIVFGKDAGSMSQGWSRPVRTSATLPSWRAVRCVSGPRAAWAQGSSTMAQSPCAMPGLPRS